MADYFDCYEHLPSTEAKKEYFLDTKDLANLPYESEPGGFGCGRATKWFKMDLLERVAEAKHGAAGLAKKRAQRKKRQDNQRKKELAAQQAAATILLPNNTNAENTAPNPCTPSPTATKATAVQAVASSISTIKTTTASELKQLRKDIVQAFQPLITWDYLNTKRAPNGCRVTARVPRISMADYAALIGRPTDTSLQTVVKKGAYYSVSDLECAVVLGNNNGIPGKGGRHGCNRQLGLDPSIPLTVKFKPSDSSLSVTGFISHRDAFGF